MNKYVIVEIIPTTRKKDTGNIAQLAALKIDNDIVSSINLRLNKEKIQIPDILNMINYDNDNFEYLNSTSKILEKFKKWSKGYKLIIIPNDYTLDYLSDLDNEKISICEIFNIEFSDNIINYIVNKYNLQLNNDIVGIIYKAIKNMK